MELGKHLVEELGHADRGTTLGRWMAHHLAGLMREAKEAGTARKRDAARKAAQKLILELWDQRASLPGNVSPLVRYERALAVLDLLSPDSLPWQRNAANARHAAVANLHDAVSKLIYAFALSEVKPELTRGQFEELAVPFLDNIEQRLLHQLGNLSIRIVDPQSEVAETTLESMDDRILAAQSPSGIFTRRRGALRFCAA